MHHLAPSSSSDVELDSSDIYCGEAIFVSRRHCRLPSIDVSDHSLHFCAISSTGLADSRPTG